MIIPWKENDGIGRVCSTYEEKSIKSTSILIQVKRTSACLSLIYIILIFLKLSTPRLCFVYKNITINILNKQFD